MLTGSTTALQMSGMVPQFFPSLGPALMISMGYVDLGKWVAAVEGGASFGFSLVLLVIFLNFCAIFCQYLATSIGVVTGKNLAQIYNKEYNRSVCIMLGLQAEVSALALDISTILGIAHGLNIVSGLDILTCILSAAVGSVILPFFITHLDKSMAEVLYVGISGFALLFYVLGVLISQPEIPLAMSGIFPRLTGETAYSLMALLGANIMVHNFYTHSSIVQQQKRPPNVGVGALSHDHFFAILFVFSGIFLVNYVVMNSAASVFDNAGFVALTFQDVFLLLDQVFGTPIPPVAFLLVLLFSSLVTALSWNIGGLVVLHDLLHLDLPALVHQVLMRMLAATLALYYAQSTGAEGIYQLLVFCQVVSAMLLPSSVIPLFRVASSRSIMSSFKIAWYLEILSLLAFFGILASNVIFATELLFGNSSWIINLRGSAGGSLSLQFIVIFSIACMSFVLMLYLAVTPLKSASCGPDMQTWAWKSQLDQQQPAEVGVGVDLDKSGYNEDVSIIEPVESVVERSLDSQSDHSVPVSNFDLPDATSDSSPLSQQPALVMNFNTGPASESNPEDSKTGVQLSHLDIVDKVPTASILERENLHDIEPKGCIDRHLQVEMNRNNEKENKGDVYEHESSKNVTPSLSQGTESSKNSKVKVEDLCGGTGTVSKMSGLGRATRRQFAAILEEFWGLLFDFHGKVTQEAMTKRADVLLGLDLKTSCSSVKGESVGGDSFKKYLPEAAKALVSMTNLRDYNCSKQQKIVSTESSFLAQMGSTSWSSNTESLSSLGQGSWHNLPEAGERRYSSLHLPQNSDNCYQPTTIHGYQVPSCLRGFGANRYTEPSSIPLEAPTPKSAELFTPNYKDPFTGILEQGRLASLTSSDLQGLALSRSRMQVERPYCGSSLLGNNDVLSSAYTKKYHSLPDISGLAISSKVTTLNDRNINWDGPSTLRAPIGSMNRVHPQYSKHLSRAEGSALAFDELSPSRLYENAFSLHSNSSLDTKSLWSKQPFEQFFGMESKTQNQEVQAATKISSAPEETFSYAESQSKILQSLRLCILKLLKLEGSDWLFRQDGGADEELIDQLAAKERFLGELGDNEVNQVYLNEPFHSCSSQKLTSAMSYEEVDVADLYPLSNCGESCIWRMNLIESFGVWCILRILELSLVESRPELWGKYTYVLNRLQGVLEPAFSKPRSPSFPCPCLSIPAAHRRTPISPLQNSLQLAAGRTSRGNCTSAITVLEIIKDVEAAISSRKGRTGTAAGDIAFPKGKENLASVLKRYKRRLSNKSPGTNEVGSLSRKVPLPQTSAF